MNPCCDSATRRLDRFRQRSPFFLPSDREPDSGNPSLPRARTHAYTPSPLPRPPVLSRGKKFPAKFPEFPPSGFGRRARGRSRLSAIGVTRQENSRRSWSSINPRRGHPMIQTRLAPNCFQVGVFANATERGGEQQQRLGSTRGDVRGAGRHDRRGDHASFAS